MKTEHSGCPCQWTTPCDPNCTCANPLMSGGCRRCASYGSPEQRTAQAERLAKIIDDYGAAEKKFGSRWPLRLIPDLSGLTPLSDEAREARKPWPPYLGLDDQ